MSEFDEIQQSLHPFSMGMGHTQQPSQEDSHGTWKDGEQQQQYNSDSSHSAGVQAKVEHKVEGSSRGTKSNKKVMVKAPHHKDRHIDSESAKVAGQMHKPPVPGNGQAAAAAAPIARQQQVSVKRSTKKKEKPTWQ